MLHIKKQYKCFNNKFFSDFNGEWNITKGVRNLSLPNGYHRKNGEDAGQYEDKPWECVKCGLIDPSVNGCGDQACKFEGQLEHDKGNAYGRKSIANHENDKRCASSNYRVLKQRLLVQLGIPSLPQLHLYYSAL